MKVKVEVADPLKKKCQIQMKLMIALKFAFMSKVLLLMMMEIILPLKQKLPYVTPDKIFCDTNIRVIFTLIWIATTPPVAAIDV